MARLGIYASQKALDTTGNNIANINTEGYTRQGIRQRSLILGGADRFMSSKDARVGSGAIVTGTAQLRDPYLDIRYRNEMSNVGAMDAKLAGLQDIADVLDEVGGGLDGEGVLEAQFNDLMEQVQNLVTQGAGRNEYDTLVRASVKSIVSMFHDYSNQLENLRSQKEKKLKQDVKEVNSILESIANLNESIRKSNIYGADALEQKDERNLLIDRLSEYVRISVTYEKEDLGAGLIVDKLVIKLKGNDTSPDPDAVKANTATLIDGVYSTRLNLDTIKMTDFQEFILMPKCEGGLGLGKSNLIFDLDDDGKTYKLNGDIDLAKINAKIKDAGLTITDGNGNTVPLEIESEEQLKEALLKDGDTLTGLQRLVLMPRSEGGLGYGTYEVEYDVDDDGNYQLADGITTIEDINAEISKLGIMVTKEDGTLGVATSLKDLGYTNEDGSEITIEQLKESEHDQLSPNYDITLRELRDTKDRLMAAVSAKGVVAVGSDGQILNYVIGKGTNAYGIAGEFDSDKEALDAVKAQVIDLNNAQQVKKDNNEDYLVYKYEKVQMSDRNGNKLTDANGKPVMGYQIKQYPVTFSREVPLWDNTLYGAIQSERELLTEQGEFATEVQTKEKPDTKNSDKNSVSIWEEKLLMDIGIANTHIKHIADLNREIKLINDGAAGPGQADKLKELISARANVISALSEYVDIDDVSDADKENTSGDLVINLKGDHTPLINGSYCAQLTGRDINEVYPAYDIILQALSDEDGNTMETTSETGEPVMTEDDPSVPVTVPVEAGKEDEALADIRARVKALNDAQQENRKPGEDYYKYSEVPVTDENDNVTGYQIYGYRVTVSKPVELTEDNLSGAIQSERLILMDQDNTDNDTDQVDEVNRAYDPNALTKRGYRYYQKALDSLANQFAKMMNDANVTVEDAQFDLDDDGNYQLADEIGMVNTMIEQFGTDKLKEELKKAGFTDEDGNPSLTEAQLNELLRPDTELKELQKMLLESSETNPDGLGLGMFEKEVVVEEKIVVKENDEGNLVADVVNIYKLDGADDIDDIIDQAMDTGHTDELTEAVKALGTQQADGSYKDKDGKTIIDATGKIVMDKYQLIEFLKPQENGLTPFQTLVLSPEDEGGLGLGVYVDKTEPTTDAAGNYQIKNGIDLINSAIVKSELKDANGLPIESLADLGCKDSAGKPVTTNAQLQEQLAKGDQMTDLQILVLMPASKGGLGLGKYKDIEGGILIDTEDGSEVVKAGNIRISQEWASGEVRIITSREFNAGSTANDNLDHLLSQLMNGNFEFKPGAVDDEAANKDTVFYKGTLQGMLTNTLELLSNDQKNTSEMLLNYATSSDELYVNRDAVMGVDLNDEAMNMMQYQKSYSAACRFMTTIDEILDKLINNTGRCGL